MSTNHRASRRSPHNSYIDHRTLGVICVEERSKSNMPFAFRRGHLRHSSHEVHRISCKLEPQALSLPPCFLILGSNTLNKQNTWSQRGRQARIVAFPCQPGTLSHRRLSLRSGLCCRLSTAKMSGRNGNLSGYHPCDTLSGYHPCGNQKLMQPPG